MRKRLSIVGLAVAGLLGTSVTGAVAEGVRDRERGTDWACVFVTSLDTGVCQQNPLPDESPIPNEARPLPAH